MISFSLSPNPLLFPILFSSTIFTLVVGILVLLKALKDDVRLVFFWLCFCLALWGFSYSLGCLGIMPAITVMAAYGTVLGALPIPLIFFLLCSCFPKGKIPFSHIQLWLLSLPSWVLFFSIFSGKLIEASVSANNTLFVRLGLFNYLYMLNILIFFAAGIALLIFRYYKATPFEKIKFRYFFAGLLLTVVIGYTLSEFALLFGVHRFVYLGPIGTIFLAGFTTYSILKYRLMDITLAIKKTTAYSLVTTAITFTYVLVVIIFEFLFRSVYGYYSFWASFPAALVIAVTFVPLRERMQGVTDQIFFRRTIEYQNIIKEVTKLIVSVTDLKTLFRLIDRTIVRAMCVKNMAVLILEEKEKFFIVEKTNGLPDEVQQVKLLPHSPLTSYLSAKKDAVVLDEIKTLQTSDLTSAQEKNDLAGAVSELERLGAAVAIPSFAKDKLVGILSMGEKLSGESYSPDDLELLLTMASEAGIAIENAKLYRDITETRDYLNSLVQESDDAIITMDLGGKILTWNKAAESISGHTSSELVGKVHPFFLESESQKLISKVLEGEAIKAHEVNIKNKDGKEIPLLLTLSPIRDTHGEVIGLSAIFKDITELKKVEQLKHEFLAVVSHELRTPLTPIKGYLALLLGGQFGQLEPKQKRALETILNQSNHLHDLIDSVIDISRIEAGKSVELEKEPLFLRNIIKQSLDSAAAAFKAKELEVGADYLSSPVAVMADRKKLLRVMDNLLGNALKFTPPKGSIRVSIQKEEAQIKVVVSDSGIGIASQHLEKIFERFYQVDSSYIRACGGIGMGLSIAQDIIAAHSGKIWAESEGPGKGTRIVFALPLETR